MRAEAPFPPVPRRLQDAPPALARACLNIRRFLHSALAVREPWPLCLAAVSGGADSTALVLCLHLLRVPLIVAHLDHGLRPESADDARHVADLAAAFDLECLMEQADVAAAAKAAGLGLEDAGRRLRYAMLERLRRERGATWIVTGHHLDYLSEDVLLRLIRGSGWPALAGMPARDDARHLLRPLLHTPRAELTDWLRLAGLPWRDDPSNSERAVRRNRIRHDLLPLIRAENPSFDQGVRRLWELARLDEAYWREITEEPVVDADREAADSILIARDRLGSLAPAARLRLYLACVRRLAEGHDGVRTGVRAGVQAGVQARADALLQLDALWRKRRTGAVVRLPGIDARLLPEGIVFERRRAPSDFT
jgi:tRNA(Ile)-lysidine synthase